MTSETSRIESFSDCVFSIAITLLVLDLKVPHGAPHSLARELAFQWPSYAAFLLSFMFVGVMWINHHRLFTHIRKSDNILLILNLLLLLGVTSVPFPTAVLASHLNGPDARTAAVLYNATYLVIAFFFNMLWRHSVSRRLIDSRSEEAAQGITRQYAYGPFLYVVCILLVWIHPLVSLFFNAVLAIFFAMPPRPSPKPTH